MTNVLPADFDGVFRFTNFTDKDFKAMWGKVEYTFPAMKTSPMIIPGATPEEVQHIRKKFARELAIEQFYKTPKFVSMNNVQPGGVPALYTDSDLQPFIQKCLEPLPVALATAVALPKTDEKTFLKTNDDGNPVTSILNKNTSLLKDSDTPIA